MPDLSEFQVLQNRSHSSGEPPWKSWSARCTNQLFLPLEKLGAKVVSLIVCAVLGAGTLVRGCLESPCWFWRVWFHICTQCESLSISLWVSHKVNLFMNWCVCEEEGTRASYFAILLMSLL